MITNPGDSIMHSIQVAHQMLVRLTERHNNEHGEFTMKTHEQNHDVKTPQQTNGHVDTTA